MPASAVPAAGLPTVSLRPPTADIKDTPARRRRRPSGGHTPRGGALRSLIPLPADDRVAVIPVDSVAKMPEVICRPKTAAAALSRPSRAHIGSLLVAKQPAKTILQPGPEAEPELEPVAQIRICLQRYGTAELMLGISEKATVLELYTAVANASSLPTIPLQHVCGITARQPELTIARVAWHGAQTISRNGFNLPAKYDPELPIRKWGIIDGVTIRQLPRPSQISLANIPEEVLVPCLVAPQHGMQVKIFL